MSRREPGNEATSRAGRQSIHLAIGIRARLADRMRRHGFRPQAVPPARTARSRGKPALPEPQAQFGLERAIHAVRGAARRLIADQESAQNDSDQNKSEKQWIIAHRTNRMIFPVVCCGLTATSACTLLHRIRQECTQALDQPRPSSLSPKIADGGVPKRHGVAHCIPIGTPHTVEYQCFLPSGPTTGKWRGWFNQGV